MIFSTLEDLLDNIETPGVLIPQKVQLEQQEIDALEIELGIKLHKSIRQILTEFNFFNSEFGTVWMLPINQIAPMRNEEVEAATILIEFADAAGYYRLHIDNTTGSIFAQNTDVPEYFEFIADSIERAILRLATIASERVAEPVELELNKQYLQREKHLNFSERTQVPRGAVFSILTQSPCPI